MDTTHSAPSGFRITEVWAYVCVPTTGADDQDEGIPAFKAPFGIMMPMVAADRRRVDALRRQARLFAGQPEVERVELRRFTTMEVVEVIEP